MNPTREPPRWLLWLCIGVVAVGSVVTVWGAISIGVTVDETFHVVRMQNYLKYGWYLLDDDLSPSGMPGNWVSDSYVYAPVTGLYLHALNCLFGIESWNVISTTADAYLIRHLGVVLLGILTTGAVAAMTRIVSGSWRWGLVAAAVLAAVPMWGGHAMFNVKDVPVATGYTMVTLACMLLLRRDSAILRRFAAIGLLAGGLVLAIGTRPAIWPGLAAAITWSLLAPLAARSAGSPPLRARGANVLLATGVSAAFLYWAYPAAFGDLQQFVLAAPSQSAGYQGRRHSWYIPIMVVCTMPLVLLAVGSLGILRRLRARRTWRRTISQSRVLLLALVVLQALLLPSMLIIKPSAFNGGLRHVLFALPAIAVLLTLGISGLLERVKGNRKRLAAVAVAVGLVAPLVTQIQLFPISYGYVNPLTDAARIGFIPDFWQGSFRELAPRIPAGSFVVCGARLDEQDRPLRLMIEGFQSPQDFSQDCSRQGALSVVQPYMADGERAITSEVGSNFVALTIYDDPAPVGCRELGRVTKWRMLTKVVASRALLCPLNLVSYEEPINFDGSGSGADYLLGGWSADGGDQSIMVVDQASFGFQIKPHVNGVSLRVDGTADGNVQFRLNNSRTRTERAPDGWVVSSREKLDELGDPGNVVLTMAVSGGTGRVSGVVVEEVFE